MYFSKGQGIMRGQMSNGGRIWQFKLRSLVLSICFKLGYKVAAFYFYLMQEASEIRHHMNYDVVFVFGTSSSVVLLSCSGKYVEEPCNSPLSSNRIEELFEMCPNRNEIFCMLYLAWR